MANPTSPVIGTVYNIAGVNYVYTADGSFEVASANASGVNTNNSLTGDGTLGSPMGVNFASLAEAESGVLTDKALNPATRFKIDSLTAETTMDINDTLPIYDSSVAADRKVSFGDLLDNIYNVPAVNNNVDATTDTVTYFNASDGAARTTTIDNFLAQNATDATTEDNLDLNNDTFSFFDTSAGAPRKTDFGNLIDQALLDATIETNLDITADRFIAYDVSATERRAFSAETLVGEVIKEATTQNAVDGNSDTVAFYDTSAGAVRKTSPVIMLGQQIFDAVTDTAPTMASDYVSFYDTTDGFANKMTFNDLVSVLDEGEGHTFSIEDNALGVPSAALGDNGDTAFVSDTAGTAGKIYAKRAGVWVETFDTASAGASTVDNTGQYLSLGTSSPSASNGLEGMVGIKLSPASLGSIQVGTTGTGIANSSVSNFNLNPTVTAYGPKTASGWPAANSGWTVILDQTNNNANEGTWFTFPATAKGVLCCGIADTHSTAGKGIFVELGHSNSAVGGSVGAYTGSPTSQDKPGFVVYLKVNKTSLNGVNESITDQIRFTNSDIFNVTKKIYIAYHT